MGDQINANKSLHLSAITNKYIVSWEPEGCYQYIKMFHWEPEGRHWCTVYGDSILLVLIGTSLNSDSALLAINWQYQALHEISPRIRGFPRILTFLKKKKKKKKKLKKKKKKKKKNHFFFFFFFYYLYKTNELQCNETEQVIYIIRLKMLF